MNEELGLTGPGVAPVKIKILDKLTDKYLELRNARIEALEQETAIKAELIESMHEHAEQIQQQDGTLAYRYDEITITLERGKEKLSVKADTEPAG